MRIGEGEQPSGCWSRRFGGVFVVGKVVVLVAVVGIVVDSEVFVVLW